MELPVFSVVLEWGGGKGEKNLLDPGDAHLGVKCDTHLIHRDKKSSSP